MFQSNVEPLAAETCWAIKSAKTRSERRDGRRRAGRTEQRTLDTARQAGRQTETRKRRREDEPSHKLFLESRASWGAGEGIMVVSVRSWLANEGGKYLVLVGKVSFESSTHIEGCKWICFF